MIEVENVHLFISSAGRISVDVQVDGRWRRIISTFHGGITDYFVCGSGLELRDETMDVTDEYQEAKP